MKARIIALVALAGVILATALLWLGRGNPDGHGTEVLISLSELPDISQDTLAAQGTLFRIEEPFLYNPTTKMGVFVTEILSIKNFDDETHVVIGGDSKSLECFRNEIRLVNSGPSRAGAAGEGVVDGGVGLAEGLWQLVRHPIDSVGGLASGIKSAAVYTWDTNASDMKDDASRLAKAFYYSKASEVAEKHQLDYFDLKTDHGKAVLHSEVNSELVGRGTMEFALLLVPFSEVKFAGKGAEAAKATQVAKAAKAVSVTEKLVEAGRLPAEAVEFAKAGRLFPRMVEKMIETINRLKSAVTTSRFNPPVAKLGEAAMMDYKATFFALNPSLEGKVVIHHAVPQSVLNRYPGLITDAQLHSFENLRGIPKGLNDTLHNSWIAKEWNEFYRMNPASVMTQEKLLQKATDIDRKFGHLFTPKIL